MTKLVEQVAIVTGGTSGIGLATARLLAARGAHVEVCGRDPAAVAQVEAEGTGVRGSRCDVRDPAQVHAWIEQVIARRGRIDIVFANAGIARFESLGEVSAASLADTLDINVKGVFYTVQQALPHLRPGARVVLCSSVANCVGAPWSSAYAASKAAVAALGRCWAAELAPRGIHVNCVSPGPTETPILHKTGLSDEDAAQLNAAVFARMTAGRLAQPEEIAQAVLYLVSPAASFMVGHDLRIGGGLGTL